MLYYENYGPYAELVKNKHMIIHTSELNKENWKFHYNCILNILKDTIETEYSRSVFITIIFDNGMDIELSLADYMYNLLMWSLILNAGSKIEPKHTFFDQSITTKSIEKFINIFFIEENMSKLPTIELNNIIDECASKYVDVDIFSHYLANTINLYDFTKLMDEYPEVDELIHSDLTGVPLSEVSRVGMDKTNKLINYIKKSPWHCLYNFFKAGEGIKPRQFKEVVTNIGTIPDGKGGVFPTIINNNFVTGGVNDIISYAIEATKGRTAQIIVENNVGDSGHLSRLLGLNNSDSFLNPDPNYICDTKNFEKVFIENDEFLCKLRNRWFRYTPKGMEYCINERDKSLIGKTIYLRSPMTCASASAGHGICYRCYGKLANINNQYINVGKYASEELGSQLTQKMLSAKHLLEAMVIALKWVEEFEELFDVDYNTVKIKDEALGKGLKLLIDMENSHLLDSSDDNNILHFTRFVNSFQVLYPDGRIVDIYTENGDNLYIVNELEELLGNDEDGTIAIDFDKLDKISLFAVKIYNNDMSKLLDSVIHTIDLTSTVEKLDRNQWLQLFIHVLIESGLNIDAVHAEIILMNQIRNVDNILDTPEWQYPNEPYKLMTLQQALRKHPSITVSLSYQYIKKALYDPLTFKKHKPSYMDLFFMEQPQLFLNEQYYEQGKDEEQHDLTKLRKIFNRNK